MVVFEINTVSSYKTLQNAGAAGAYWYPYKSRFFGRHMVYG